MDKIKKILLENKAWAESRLDIDQEYFKKMAVDQKPEYLWIGCSDSRVPPSEITNTDPGQMFVHRNIANLVVHTDMNLLSVLQYAVENLEIPHVIVCGHYNCGGVKAALSNKSLGMMNNWVRNIKDIYFNNKVDIDSIQDEATRVNKLVELNVVEQVQHLAHTSIIQRSWNVRKKPYLHGWVYDINTGLLKKLITVEPGSDIDSAYRFDY
jgi:carbonic anhydrase